MRLHYSPTSPFVRKVTATAYELGLEAQLEQVPTRTKPTAPDAELVLHNPLGKMPALEVRAGEWLYDSPVICEYLDTLHSGRPLVPRGGWERFRVLRTQALADGIIEACVGTFYERARPADKQWQDFERGQVRKVRDGFDLLEREPEYYGGPFDLGQLTVAVAIDYSQLRKVVTDFASRWPRLTAWHKQVSQRRALVETVPREW